MLVATLTTTGCMSLQIEAQWSVFVGLAAAFAAAGCGQNTSDLGRDSVTDGREGAPGAASATRPPRPAPTAPADCTIGDRRDAMGPEAAEAKYCVCEAEDAVGKVWRCYGPAAGAPRPKADCSWSFVQPGDAASCFVSWSECSDGRVYSLSCVNRFCVCLVNGKAGAELEPGTRCPEEVSQLNELCGWSLGR